MASEDTPVWFISGCSTGLGRELAEAVLARGWRVVATARAQDSVADIAASAPDRALALAMDVTIGNEIAAAVAATEDRFGRIDVLVNNAGYGYQAAIEEGDDLEIRDMFETNVFGLFALTRAVLPGMRIRRSGHILNISSVAGFAGYPGSGYYAATKHAVEGFTDALAAETAPLGLRVACIEPGPFRTDWAGRSLKQTPNVIVDYADTAGARMATTSGYSGTQAGDPARAAQSMIALTEQADPPRHLVLGKWGHDAVVQTLRDRLTAIEGQRDTALAADFPGES